MGNDNGDDLCLDGIVLNAPDPDSEPTPERIPKYKALARLRAEGLEAEFRERQAYWRSMQGGRLSVTDAFYTALGEFPERGLIEEST